MILLSIITSVLLHRDGQSATAVAATAGAGRERTAPNRAPTLHLWRDSIQRDLWSDHTCPLLSKMEDLSMRSFLNRRARRLALITVALPAAAWALEQAAQRSETRDPNSSTSRRLRLGRV
jgi:hypothetical protein